MDVRGRITEAHLPMAEESYPGICEIYEALEDKPSTFLQLVFIYEELCELAMAPFEADELALAPAGSRN